jgi:Condensin II non structural maintenance of chromosomes subunit
MLHHVASIIVSSWNLAPANVKAIIQTEMILPLVNACILARDKRLFHRILIILSHIYATPNKEMHFYFEYMVQTRIKPFLQVENHQVRWNSLYLLGLMCHPSDLALQLNTNSLLDDFVQNRVLAIQQMCHIVFLEGISCMNLIDSLLLPLLMDASSHTVRMTVIKELIPIVRKYNVWRFEWQGE